MFAFIIVHDDACHPIELTCEHMVVFFGHILGQVGSIL